MIGPGPARHRRLENALGGAAWWTTLAGRDRFEWVRNIGEGDGEGNRWKKGWWHVCYGYRNGGASGR